MNALWCFPGLNFDDLHTKSIKQPSALRPKASRHH